MNEALRPLLSSDSPNFRTPPEVLDPIRAFRPIHFDPFGNADSLVGAEVTICPPADSLVIPWPRCGLFFANPPYGRALAACAAKIRAEAELGAEGITLVPARTDTKWLEDPAPLRWCAWSGRVTFLETWEEWIARRERAIERDGDAAIRSDIEPCIGDLIADDPAPFPVALCYHGPAPEEFTAHFARYGTIYAPVGAATAPPRRRGVTGRRPGPRVAVERVRELLERGFSVREMAEACTAKKHQIETALRKLRALSDAGALSGNAHVFGQSAGVAPDPRASCNAPLPLSGNVLVCGQSPPAVPETSPPAPDPLLSLLQSIADGSRPIEDVDPALWPALNKDYLAVRTLVPGPPGRKPTAVEHVQITDFGLRRIGRLPARKRAVDHATVDALGGAASW